MIIEIETSQPLSETDVGMLLSLIAASGHVETEDDEEDES